MRRLLATTCLCSAFLVAPACDKKEEQSKETAKADKTAETKDSAKDGAKDEAKPEDTAKKAAQSGALIDLVPEAATMVGVVNIKGLMGTALYKGQSAAIDGSPAGKHITMAKACNLGTETWRQVVVAGDPEAGEDAMVVGMAATGIGKKENIECLAAKYKEDDPKNDWKVEEQDGRVVVTIDGGDRMAYTSGDDMVVMASKAWAAAVKDRVEGKGQSATAGPLEEALGLADTNKLIYVAGVATPKIATGPVKDAKHFAAGIDVGLTDVSAQIVVGFADAVSYGYPGGAGLRVIAIPPAG